MIQWMLAIWSLVPLPFLKPAWTSGSSRFTYCWSLAWRILRITLLVCEITTIGSSLSILWHYLSFGFPGGSDGKVSAYNAGDPGSIPGLGRSPEEAKGHSNILAWINSPWGHKELDSSFKSYLFFCFSSFFSSQRKAMPKNAQTTTQLHSSHTLVK